MLRKTQPQDLSELRKTIIIRYLNRIAVTSVGSGKPTDTASSIASAAHQYRSGAFILFLFRFVLFNFRWFLLLFFPEVTRWCIGEHAHLHGTILCYTCTHTHTHTHIYTHTHTHAHFSCIFGRSNSSGQMTLRIQIWLCI